MQRYKIENESEDYAKQREALLQAEIALMQQRERVAALRRELPRDTPVDEAWRFEEGPRDLQAGDEPVETRTLGALFEDPSKPLVLLHFMFGAAQTSVCPMCSLWADGYDGIINHLEQRVNFAIVVAGDLARIRSHARERGWRNVRIVSSQGSTFKRDLGFEAAEGGQSPGVSVFERGDDARITHFYSHGAQMTEELFRGMDLLSPLWNFLDLTPEGRGDFMPRFDYA